MGKPAKNDVTGDAIVSATVTDAYRSNFDVIFKKKECSHTWAYLYETGNGLYCLNCGKREMENGDEIDP